MSAWVVTSECPWGDALARRLAAAEQQVTLIVPKPSRKKRPKGITASTDLAAALAGAERVVLAEDINGIDARLREMAPHLQGNHRVLACARGLTHDLHRRPSEAIQAYTCVRQIAVLAGAATPKSVSKGDAGALVIGSAFPAWARELQTVLTAEALRVYTNADAPGVEMAAAFSAILGVAMGTARGLGVGASTEATALTRALAEMDRLVTGFGGRPGTAFGLAGLGVLAEATLSGAGEPMAAGVALAKGESTEAFTDLTDLTYRMAARADSQKLRAPMTQAVAALFSGRLAADDMFKMLMTRMARAE